MTKTTHAIYLTAQSLKRQEGFNIVELMISILLGLFLVIGVGNILISDQMSFNAANRLARVQENGHLAKNMLAGDLKRARYMGANIAMGGIAGTAGEILPARSCNTSDTTWGRMVRQGLFGIDDSQNVTDIYNCLTGNDDGVGDYLRGDVLTLRFSSPWNLTAQDDFDDDRLYIRHAYNVTRIFVGEDQDNPINDAVFGAASTHELIAYSYYIGDSGRTCSGQPVPSLFRVRLNGQGRPETEELFPGIEDFQVQFSTNGTDYNSADNIPNADDGNPDWNAIVATRFWLLARSECEEMGLTNDRNYTLVGSNYTPDGQYRREAYSSIVSHRN